MQKKIKRVHPKEKTKLHLRNKHRERYDFGQLIASCPDLAPFVRLNDYDDQSIDFFNPEAVKMLNKALLIHFYGIKAWDVPPNYLCPPIPGRADYIHHIADLLYQSAPGFKKKNALDTAIKCLDIGVGANCVYPIIGQHEYSWSFVGSDIDPVAIQSANKIIASNPLLKNNVECRLQVHSENVFQGIIHQDELFDLTICNPPFHASQAEAQAGTVRKLRNLTQRRTSKPTLNFGGQNKELWCKGGEVEFVRTMIDESKQFSHSCLWFSTLISKQANLPGALDKLKNVEAVNVKTIEMGQGNKISRILAWTFLSTKDQQDWFRARRTVK